MLFHASRTCWCNTAGVIKVGKLKEVLSNHLLQRPNWWQIWQLGCAEKLLIILQNIMHSTSTSGWYAIQNGLNNLDIHVTNTSPSTRQAMVLTDGIYTMMLGVLQFFLGKYTLEIVSPQAYVAHANVHHLHVGRTCCHHWMSTNLSPSWPNYTTGDVHGGGVAEVCPGRYMFYCK